MESTALIYFKDEAPRLGSGWRKVTVRVGRKWVRISGRYGRSTRFSIDAYARLLKKEENKVTDNKGDLSIPTFLKREKGNPMSEVEAPAKPVKGKAAKPAKAETKATAPAKAAAKPAKGPAKAKTPLDAFGYREGSLKSKAAAMYAAKSGATLAEVKAALGSVQLNVLTELEGKGHKKTTTKEAGEGGRKVTRYQIK